MTQLLTQAEVAALLCISERTVQDWRYSRKGPPAIFFGRLVRYRQDDVEAWIESRPRRAAHEGQQRQKRASTAGNLALAVPDRRQGVFGQHRLGRHTTKQERSAEAGRN